MRHATGISMVEAGMPLPVIKIFFGHSSISTTEIYGRITQPHLEQRIKDRNNSFWASAVDDVHGDSQEIDSVSRDEAIPEFLR